MAGQRRKAIFIHSYCSLSYFLFFFLEMLLLSHPHTRGCASWLAGPLSCSPKVLHAGILLAITGVCACFRLSFFPGSVLRRGLEVFVLFHFVMVYRDRSWEIVQMEFITVSTNGEEESQWKEAQDTDVFYRNISPRPLLAATILRKQHCTVLEGCSPRLHLQAYMCNQVALQCKVRATG